MNALCFLFVLGIIHASSEWILTTFRVVSASEPSFLRQNPIESTTFKNRPSNSQKRAPAFKVERRSSNDGVVPLKKFDLVKYENHPMQDWADRHRNLLLNQEGSESVASEQDSSVDSPTARKLEKSLFQGDSWRPLRVSFYTEALELLHDGGENTLKINFINDELLPQLAEFWSSALSVIPVWGNLYVDEDDLSEGGYCAGESFSVVPESHTTRGEGLPDTDLVLYVSANKEHCSEGTLAYANACSYDAFDRPVAGAVNVCLDEINFHLNGWTRERFVQHSLNIAIHEIAHVLFMSPGHFLFFRFADGTPRTSRPIRATTIQCPNGERKKTHLPDKNTLDFFTDSNGNQHATIVTDRVKAVTRNQFDCQSLPGARLENKPTSDSCIGAHWDERESYSSTMSAIVDDTGTFLTPASLALAEDSSWYKSNYAVSRISPWGHGAGCSFVDDPCLVLNENGEMVVPDYGRGFFCAKRFEMGCNAAHTHKLMCYDVPPQMGENPKCLVYSAPYETEADIISSVTGLDLDGLNCRKESDDLLNAHHEYFGDDSMCFETMSPVRKGLCYQAYCVVNERALKVNLANEWYTCKEDFQVINNAVVCPRLASACPQMFCPANCAGRGVCDYKNVENGTVAPKCVCDDPSDSSAGCSAGFIFDSKYVATSSDLPEFRANNRFFDPLVSIFVDSPSSWGRATLGWFIGLLLFSLGIIALCVFWMRKRARKAEPYDFT